MLVLSRKEGESLLIGDGIEVSIVKVQGGQVKLAIQAPKEVKVLRKELTAPQEKPVIKFKKVA